MELSDLTKRDVVECIGQGRAFHGQLGMVGFSERIWDLDREYRKGMILKDVLVAGRPYGPASPVLSAYEILTSVLKVMELSKRRFISFIELAVHPMTVPDQRERMVIIRRLSTLLLPGGHALVETHRVLRQAVHGVLPLPRIPPVPGGDELGHELRTFLREAGHLTEDMGSHDPTRRAHAEDLARALLHHTKVWIQSRYPEAPWLHEDFECAGDETGDPCYPSQRRPLDAIFGRKMAYLRLMLNELSPSQTASSGTSPGPGGDAGSMTRATTFEQGVGEAITARTATGIFIVHGHDDGMKEAVARFIEKLGLTATILNESAPKSQTLIEKLEKKAGACCFAVVLLSPDDLCCATNSSTKSPRARQNVVFEMGFFFSHLGRDNVLVLRKAGVEGLSDTDGIEYVPWEKAEWRMKLAASMREAKVPISEERLLAALGLADRHAISKPT